MQTTPTSFAVLYHYQKRKTVPVCPAPALGEPQGDLSQKPGLDALLACSPKLVDSQFHLHTVCIYSIISLLELKFT